MTDRPDYILDVSGVPTRRTPMQAHPGPTDGGACPRMTGRPWLAMYWRCCEVYSRIYRNRRGTAYDGRCPRCGKRVCIRIGQGGTKQRFFEAI